MDMSDAEIGRAVRIALRDQGFSNLGISENDLRHAVEEFVHNPQRAKRPEDVREPLARQGERAWHQRAGGSETFGG